MTPAHPDLPRRDRPPFRLAPEACLASLTRDIEACFAALRGVPALLQWCLESLAAVRGWDPGAPLVRALARLAAEADRGRLIRPLAYHDRVHTAEVMLGAHFIALLRELLARDAQELIAAALIHDLGHDGGANLDQPFRLERRALASARPALAEAGVGADCVARLAAMVYATELGLGLPRVRAWYLHHRRGEPAPAGEEAAAALAPIAADPGLATLALALAEADSLASAGLSVAGGQASQARLAEEWGRPLGPADALAYFDLAFPRGFLVARIFDPNLQAARRVAAAAANMNSN